MDGKYLESSGNGVPLLRDESLLRDEYSKTFSIQDDEREHGYEQDEEGNISPRSVIKQEL